MGKRAKRSAESVKRRSKARKLKRRINHKLELPGESGEETRSETVVKSENHTVEFPSEPGKEASSKISFESDSDSECEHTGSFSSQHCDKAATRRISNPQKQTNRLHKLLVTSTKDPLIVGLQMMNDLKMQKILLSQNTHIYSDPNSHNKPF